METIFDIRVAKLEEKLERLEEEKKIELDCLAEIENKAQNSIILEKENIILETKWHVNFLEKEIARLKKLIKQNVYLAQAEQNILKYENELTPVLLEMGKTQQELKTIGIKKRKKENLQGHLRRVDSHVKRLSKKINTERNHILVYIKRIDKELNKEKGQAGRPKGLKNADCKIKLAN